MRILFDQGVPHPLKKSFVGVEVKTAREMDWSTLENGTLIDAAEAAGFTVLVTTDKNLRYQQDLSARQITIVVLPTTAWPKLSQIANQISVTVRQASPGSYLEVDHEGGT